MLRKWGVIRRISTAFSTQINRKLCEKSPENIQADATNYFAYKAGLNVDDQQKVLDVLNKITPDELIRYSVSKNRIKNMELWKSKNGSFKSLNDVLDVEGFGERVLEKICKRIIEEDKVGYKEHFKPKIVVDKRVRQVAMPVLPDNLNKLVKATGIYLSPTGISWAQLIREGNELVEWNMELFTSLPKKTTLLENFNLVYKVIQKLPHSDVYLLESQLNAGLNSGNLSQAALYQQQVEVSSMLLALINTSLKHNAKVPENCVFQMKNRLAARLFNLMVGSERISAVQTIDKIFGRCEDNNLPCTPIKFNEKFKESYLSQQPMNKELLGRALLLTISFMDVFVYKNTQSLNILFPNKNNK